MNATPYAHIHEKFRHIAHLPDNERIDFLHAPRWIGYKTANEVLEIMQGLMNRIKQHRMPNLLLIGDSNNGKTTVIKRFNEKFGETYIDDNDSLNVPVRLIQAPPSANEKELYISLIDSLGLPYRSSDSSGILRHQVIHAFRETHVRILIIDEVLAVGDIAFQSKCIQTITDFKKRGVTILFVSHNMSDVEKICDRVIWIENHRLREVGSAERIIELYKQAMA